MNTDGIASDLGVKPTSVITFRKRAYAKLGITTQAELFARSLQVFPEIARRRLRSRRPIGDSQSD